MFQAGRPHAFFLCRGCSHLACFLNSFLNRNLFVCLCTASTLFIWLSVLWQLAKLFRTTLRAAPTTCVWRLSHIKLQAFYSNWLSFPAVVRTRGEATSTKIQTHFTTFFHSQSSSLWTMMSCHVV